MSANMREYSSDLTGEEVVISGISGIYPKSDSVAEFMFNLFNKVDMVTSNDENFSYIHPDMPKYSGQVRGFNLFDAQFFRVPHGQAECMDSMTFKLLENAYGALFDAGVNPKTLAGQKVGVFVGSSFMDIANDNLFNCDQSNYFITGCSKTMQANRISYWLDGKGPSHGIDMTCVSSIAALDEGFKAIKHGRCDSAIVAGCNQLLSPMLSANLRRKGLLCLDGKTKCFDKYADGYVRSEAVTVMFLQRASVAKRIYAEIVHIKHKYLMRPENNFLPIREADDIEEWLRKFYSEVDIAPSDVEYVEACGTGIAQADANELEAISRVFANGKSINIGSVKSNMGHSEGASDLCSLTKKCIGGGYHLPGGPVVYPPLAVCLAYHKGEIPGNLHYNVPQDDIAGVRDGRVNVVTDNIQFKRGYTAFNSFSFTGMNYHTLIKGHYKKKKLDRYYSSIPRLVLASGRTDRSVSKIFDALKRQPIDAEQIDLLNSFFTTDVSGHTFRGYTILATNECNETTSVAASTDHLSGVSSSVWFLYSGMGCQWPAMGAELMKIPTFAASIERCRKVLEPKGIDIVKILTVDDDTIFDNILHSFVGIAAMQIALTDLLREMGIVPDNIIGHSVGEHGCAYADGCFTAEEMMLVSYYRGLVSVKTTFIDGLMAAVGLGHEKVSILCPPEIEVACHNSADSSTISGPAEIVKEFVEKLKSQGVFAKVVQTANIAYHSKYISQAGSRLRPTLKEVIRTPKLRSEKWLCTSAPPAKWDHGDVKLASSEYFTNNLLNKVYFQEAAQTIPENATIIEISPHGLMQAILRRSHSRCNNVPLTSRGNPSPVNFLLDAVGKLYQLGFNPKIDFLYPKVHYPVSTETPLLSQFVDWVYDTDRCHVTNNKPSIRKTLSRNFAMILLDDDWKYIQGHVRNGAIIFPETALLVLVWETLAMCKGLHYKDMSVVFETVRFDKELYIIKNETVRFTICLQKNNRFEICQKGVQIASGFVAMYASELNKLSPEDNDVRKETVLTAQDIYTLLGVKGYAYKGEFQSIISTNIKLNQASINWTNEWVTFLDSLIQLNVLSKNHDGVSIPKFITKLIIDTALHKEAQYTVTNDVLSLYAIYDDMNGTTRCSGVQIMDMVFYEKPILEKIAQIEQLTFVPHDCTIINLYEAIKINLQIVTENLGGKHLKITEVMTDLKIIKHNDKIKDILENKLHVNAEVNCVQIKSNKIKDFIERSEDTRFVHMFVINTNLKDIYHYFEVLKNTGDIFILNIVPGNCNLIENHGTYLDVITNFTVGKEKMILLRNNVPCVKSTNILVDQRNFSSWVQYVKNDLDKCVKWVIISQKYPYELIRMIKNLQEEGFYNIRLIMVDYDQATQFSARNSFYTRQIKKDLMVNIFKKGHWGGYYSISTGNEKVRNQSIALASKSFSNCNTWTWVENPLNLNSNNLVKVAYSGPSLYDYQNMMIKVNCNNAYGMDFSGYNCRGERVMGLVAGGALATMLEADPMLIWPVPQHWSLQEAASVPLHYALAYYCLAIRGRLYKNETVLVLGGAGALGQAVIALCLALNCTVFTTVRDKNKKKFLLSLYPRLRPEYIICTSSDSTSIYAMIAHYTKNSLCNYVISCATGEMRKEAINCVGKFGDFMNVNSHDEVENMDFEMFYCCRGRSYKAINLTNIFQTEYVDQKMVIHQLISEGIAQGVVKPISSVVFPPTEISTAIKFLLSNNRKGRVLIRMGDTTDIDNLNVMTRVSFSPEASYLIIGCNSFIGIELADWLIKRGARKVILHRQNNIRNGYLQTKQDGMYRSWQNYGVISTVSTANLQDIDECDSLLSKCEELAPLRGIFILQPVRSDHEDSSFADVVNPISVVSNLDKITRKRCHKLSEFVFISDSNLNSGINMEVSAIKRICEIRNEDLHPALVIHARSIDEATSNSDETLAERLSELFNTLEISIKYKYSNVVTRDVKKCVKTTFLTQIYNIFDALGYSNIEEDKTLRSLNISELCIDEIRHLINKNIKTDYSKEELRDFTIARLKNMCKGKKEDNLITEDFRLFHNSIEPDEVLASEPIVKMASKLTNCSKNLSSELNSTDTHLILIPGFEGHSRIFSSIGEILKVQAVTLQLSPDLEGESIRDMALVLFKHIMKTFVFKSKFYILGYSFGVNIALELAALLEKEGCLGVVYCLDSSPYSVCAQLEAHLGKMTEMELQNYIIKDFYQRITGKTDAELNRQLEKYERWSDKVVIGLKKLRSSVSYSNDYQKTVLNAMYKRIKLAREYESKFILESEIILIRGHSYTSENLPDDYHLSKYSRKPIRVIQIESDHLSAPYHSGVAGVVNKMLDRDLLEEYKGMNLCEVCYENNLKNIRSKKRTRIAV